MKYVKFEISKFKGIEHLVLDLWKIPRWKIFPLVWLNESGKTTILESINLFQEEVSDEKKFTYIHKKDLASFSWKISCAATLELDDEDELLIENLCKAHKLKVKWPLEKVTIKILYIFENSEYKRKEINRMPPIFVKANWDRSFKSLYDVDRDFWNELIWELRKRFPKILYFPNFLFDFPENIYLENIEVLNMSDKEKEVQNIYKDIISDVLLYSWSSLSDYLQKKKWWDNWNIAQLSAAGAIEKRLSSALEKNIIEPRSNIFPGPEKLIDVSISKDGIWYFLNLSISIWDSKYLVSEMSLWFRRFFSFILFTEFRKSRDNESWEYLFLFDEPASNLHENSQKKLLTIFDKLVERGTAKIIYSTHSPYLISPKYILNAFVIKDTWRNNAEDEFIYRQDIKAISYREFVGNTPEDYSHFKPILDALDFSTNPFELTNNIIFTEWKHDYYTFKRIRETFFNDNSYDFKFYPWWWVTSYEKVLRDYVANNRNFICIFDWDIEWKQAKNDYIEHISKELESYIFTLNNIDTNFDWKTTELLFSDNDRLNIQKITFATDSRYNKTHFNKSIENAFINNIEYELSEETINNFKKIFDFIKLKLEN